MMIKPRGQPRKPWKSMTVTVPLPVVGLVKKLINDWKASVQKPDEPVI